jgi:hypothetical protein
VVAKAGCTVIVNIFSNLMNLTLTMNTATQILNLHLGVLVRKQRSDISETKILLKVALKTKHLDQLWVTGKCHSNCSVISVYFFYCATLKV